MFFFFSIESGVAFAIDHMHSRTSQSVWGKSVRSKDLLDGNERKNLGSLCKQDLIVLYSASWASAFPHIVCGLLRCAL
jgi:hypothetical protein